MLIYLRILLFLVFNFAALGLGGFFTGSGVPSEWYQTLQKAPWTPPGWVFGAAWTTIMIAFSFYAAWLWQETQGSRTFWVFYGLQWVLNVAWNPTFFHFHATRFALVLIVALTLGLWIGFFTFWRVLSFRSLTLVPYLVWLVIATSLNTYIVWNNP